MNDLVLVHGWGFGSAVWRPVVDLLAAEFRLHAVDLPGYGGNDAGPVRVPPNAIVCAWSLGALEAMQWALAEPKRISRLVLVGATPRFVQAADWPHAQPPEVFDRFAEMVAASPATALKRFAALVNQDDIQARSLLRSLSALIEGGRVEAPTLLSGLAELRGTDLRAAVPGISQPTLVLHGANDRLAPPAAGRWLADHLPRCRLQMFPEAAHAPFLSDPQRFAELLVAFANDPE